MYNRVFITGDTHGDKVRLTRIISEYRLSQGDLLIVIGDFGYIMRNTYYEDEFLDSICKSHTCHIAFVLGNHEHFPRIFQHRKVPFCKGEAIEIRSNIFCLLNGEIYEVPTPKGEKKIFVMGGAAFIDKGMNPDRYATLWLKADRAKNLVELIRSDAPEYKTATEGYEVINDRGKCYELADTIYDFLKDKVDKYMPDYAKEYAAVSAVNRDTIRFTQALKIRSVLERLLMPCYRETRDEFYGVILSTLDKLGLADEPVRFVLQEGTWFNEEIPSANDYKNATENLKKHSMKVDYILSHTMPREMILRHGVYPYYKGSELTSFLEWVMHECYYEMHYCGHWHQDAFIGDKLRLLFSNVVQM